MKLGLINKINKRNMATSKKKRKKKADDIFMLANYEVIVDLRSIRSNPQAGFWTHSL